MRRRLSIYINKVAVFPRYLRCIFEKPCLKYKPHRFAYIVRMSSGSEYYLYSPIIKAVDAFNQVLKTITLYFERPTPFRMCTALDLHYNCSLNRFYTSNCADIVVYLSVLCHYKVSSLLWVG